jgi:uncharacterized UPF0160 family protein
MIQKIITHDGLFHADEVFACALLQCVFGEIPIVRTRDLTIDDMNDPTIWVVDVAQVYNPELGLFDHHQDGRLESSNMLVLIALKGFDYIDMSLYLALRGAFQSISNIDCGGYEGYNGFQVNSLIKSLNSLPETKDDKDKNFLTAVSIAKLYITAKMLDCSREEESRDDFEAGDEPTMGVRVCEKFPLFWKSYNECVFLVAPNKSGKWCVHSIDNKKYPMEATGKEEYFHPQKMQGVYSCKEDAVESALAQAVNTFS